MLLIIGGAYQGKLDYALENYPDKSIFHCTVETAEIDLSADIINALHLLILGQTRTETDTLAYLREILPELKNKIIICDDISCGVVPINPETRQWRETLGRSLVLLSKNSNEVIRVFCGIGSKIK